MIPAPNFQTVLSSIVSWLATSRRPSTAPNTEKTAGRTDGGNKSPHHSLGPIATGPAPRPPARLTTRFKMAKTDGGDIPYVWETVWSGCVFSPPATRAIHATFSEPILRHKVQTTTATSTDFCSSNNARASALTSCCSQSFKCPQRGARDYRSQVRRNQLPKFRTFETKKKFGFRVSD